MVTTVLVFEHHIGHLVSDGATLFSIAHAALRIAALWEHRGFWSSRERKEGGTGGEEKDRQMMTILEGTDACN